MDGRFDITILRYAWVQCEHVLKLSGAKVRGAVERRSTKRRWPDCFFSSGFAAFGALLLLAPSAKQALADEIGANDFRISDMGPDGDANFDASFGSGWAIWGKPAVAYNATADEYLVVWMGDDGSGAQLDDEFEIYAQRLDALTGEEVGPNDYRISDMGPDGEAEAFGRYPAVVYNPSADEYLVVWDGDEGTDAPVDDGREIYAQRLEGSTGAEIGADDFRISRVGAEGRVDLNANLPAVTYNPDADEYLVVWLADTENDDEYEIYGQRIDARTGAEIGPDDFRISDMGPDGDADFSAFSPSVAYNPNAGEYLVVWWGDDIDQDFEIFGQRLDGGTGEEIGVNDFRISDRISRGGFPAVVYNPNADEYLVVWHALPDTGSDPNPGAEIFGQRLDGSTAEEVGCNDFRISDMGPDGDANFGAGYPAVAYNASADEYLVVWRGDDDSDGLVDGEREIFGQRLDGATGLEIGPNDFRISDMGLDGHTAFEAINPALPQNPRADDFLVVWEGDDDTGALVDDEVEIFGQLVWIPDEQLATANSDDFVSYRIRRSRQGPKFYRFGPVRLSDRFGMADYEVVKPAQLLLPADAGGAGVFDGVTHLEEYRIKPTRETPRFAMLRNIEFRNRFGEHLLELKKPTSLLVPTHKSTSGPVEAPDPEEHLLDHFLCYKAKHQQRLDDGTRLPRFAKGTQVVVEDQFQTRRYDLKRITKLCSPVAKSEDASTPATLRSGPMRGALFPIEPAGIRNPDRHLVCYQAKFTSREIQQTGCGCNEAVDATCRGTRLDSRQPRHAKRNGLYTNNQFGPGLLDTIGEVEFCVPSLLSPRET